MLPPLPEILSTTRVVSLPLRRPFRGLIAREALVFEGPQGWTEFSPFVEYDDSEASTWLTAAIEFGWRETPAVFRNRIRVNATLPAVDAQDVPAALASFAGCRTVKVKVAERGQVLADDVARVRAARTHVGVEGRVRVDANGGWNLDEAEHAIHALAEFDLEYVEQPCASVAELAEIRGRVKYMGIPIAADESVRRADDPLLVAREGAADLLVAKAQPLGGIRAGLAIASASRLPIVVSSALDTSIGLSMGAWFAAALPDHDFDCGLGTAALLAADVTESPLQPVDGSIEVRRVQASEALLTKFAAPDDRLTWWIDRLSRCHEILAARD